MSLYGQYIKTREDFDIIENSLGFATYKIINSECYLRDIFVDPEVRETAVARDLADQICVIARESGCKTLLGSVCPSAKGATVSLKVLLAYGMSLKSCTNDFIVMEKGL
jgi:hypothetical protein